MGDLQTIDEGTNSDIERREESKDLTAEFDIDQLESGSGLKEIKDKSIEIINKNTKLVKYQKQLYRQKFIFEKEYNKQRQQIELDEIKLNLAKDKKEQLTKTQLDILIDSKISSDKLDKIKNEISICELISKNHLLTSDQLKNYNLSETTYRRSLQSNIL